MRNRSKVGTSSRRVNAELEYRDVRSWEIQFWVSSRSVTVLWGRRFACAKPKHHKPAAPGDLSCRQRRNFSAASGNNSLGALGNIPNSWFSSASIIWALKTARGLADWFLCSTYWVRSTCRLALIKGEIAPLPNTPGCRFTSEMPGRGQLLVNRRKTWRVDRSDACCKVLRKINSLGNHWARNLCATRT